MKLSPNVAVNRFAQLEPGDLFILVDRRFGCVAMKTVDPENDNDNPILMLGPTFPENLIGPLLLPWDRATTISFGKQFELVLPILPSSWSEDQPEKIRPAILVAENKAYFRANFARFPNEFSECFVALEDGVVRYRRPAGTAAYTDTWTITVSGADSGRQVILAH